jgi:FixJ family two-component response regulator
VSVEPRLAVVDDDDAFRTALVESLDSLGYSARGYASAEEFLASADEALCDCLITDIHMPGRSGIDLQRQLAAQGSTTAVIMITARSDRELEAKVLESGAFCLLRKPFDSTTLVDCIERALNG